MQSIWNHIGLIMEIYEEVQHFIINSPVLLEGLEPSIRFYCTDSSIYKRPQSSALSEFFRQHLGTITLPILYLYESFQPFEIRLAVSQFILATPVIYSHLYLL